MVFCLTELIYQICGNDTKRFYRALEMLRAAFEAGAKVEREACAKLVVSIEAISPLIARKIATAIRARGGKDAPS